MAASGASRPGASEGRRRAKKVGKRRATRRNRGKGLFFFAVVPAPACPTAADIAADTAAATTVAATFRCASQAADLNLHQLMNSATLLLAKEAAVAKHENPTHGNGGDGGDGSNSSGTSMAASSMGGGARRKRASPTRVWECLAAVASGDLRGLLESEAANAGAGLLDSMAASGAGGGGRPAVELRGGTGGEVAAGLSCQRLLVEAGAFERFGYSDMAVACARSILQVTFGVWLVYASVRFHGVRSGGFCRVPVHGRAVTTSVSWACPAVLHASSIGLFCPASGEACDCGCVVRVNGCARVHISIAIP